MFQSGQPTSRRAVLAILGATLAARGSGLIPEPSSLSVHHITPDMVLRTCRGEDVVVAVVPPPQPGRRIRIRGVVTIDGMPGKFVVTDEVSE